MNINTIINENDIREVQSAQSAIAQACDMLDYAKQKLFANLRDNFMNSPDQFITRADIVAATGLSAREVDDRMMTQIHFPRGTKTITKKFAEIGPDGTLVPGGRLKTDKRNYVVYYRLK